MKKTYFLFIIPLFLIFSCSEDEIKVYKSGDYIQFSNSVVDSSTYSFLPYPDSSQLRFPLAVELIGMPSKADRKYKIGVVSKLTSAPKENYEIPSEFIFRAGMAKDTCWILLKKTPEISKKPVRLTVELVASEDFQIGQTEYATSIIYISNVIFKPDWWTKAVTRYYLGDYSDKKYQLFIEVTGKMDVVDEEELRNNTLLLKYHLLKEKDAGRTVYEDDGTEMTVSLIMG